MAKALHGPTRTRNTPRPPCRALHLLQSALVHINTLLLPQVRAEPAWANKLSEEDRRGLNALYEKCDPLTDDAGGR